MLSLRTDVAWKEKGGSGFLQVGSSNYRLDGAPVEKQRQWWAAIKGKSDMPFEDGDFEKFVDLLASLRAFSATDEWETYGRDFGLSLKGFDAKLHELKIGVFGDVDLVSRLVGQLKWASFQPFQSDGMDAMLVVARTTQDGIFREYNRQTFESQKRALFVAFDPFGLRVGPWVLPGESACYSCMALRRQDNFLHSESILFDGLVSEVRDALPGPFADAGISIVSTSLLQFFMAEVGNAVFVPTIGHVVEYNWLDGSVVSRKILRHPECRECFPHRTPSSLWVPGVNSPAEAP